MRLPASLSRQLLTTSSILLCCLCAAQCLNAQSGTGDIVATKYHPSPVPNVKSVPKLSKTEFVEKFKQACFPREYWSGKMILDVEPVDIPDQDFYKFAYRVVSVKSKDGKLDLLQTVKDGDQQSRWWRFSVGKGKIELPVSLDGVTVETTKDGKKLSNRDIESLKKKSLGEATLEVTLSREEKLTAFELTTDKPKQKGVVHCWGLPERVELTVRGPMLSRTWDYDVKLGDTDETAYETFRNRTRSVYQIGLKLHELHKVRRSPHNQTVAGMRYVFKKGTDEPSNLVSEEIALSDPKGAELFQYKVKPYLGYHFIFTDSYLKAGKEKPRFSEKSKKEMVKWSGGEVEVYRLVPSYSSPVAWPADPADPMVHLVGRQVYYKAVDVTKEEPAPDGKSLKEDWAVGPELPQRQQ